MKTKWLILIAVLTGAVAFWGCGGSGSTGPSPGGTELEGTWVFNDTLFRMTFTFEESNWTAVQEYWSDQDTTFTWNGTFSLNTTVVPKHIDLLCSSSPDTNQIGKTSLGIYALNTAATACSLAVTDFGDTVRPIDFHNAMILTKQ